MARNTHILSAQEAFARRFALAFTTKHPCHVSMLDKDPAFSSASSSSSPSLPLPKSKLKLNTSLLSSLKTSSAPDIQAKPVPLPFFSPLDPSLSSPPHAHSPPHRLAQKYELLPETDDEKTHDPYKPSVVSSLRLPLTSEPDVYLVDRIGEPSTLVYGGYYTRLVPHYHYPRCSYRDDRLRIIGLDPQRYFLDVDVTDYKAIKKISAEPKGATRLASRLSLVHEKHVQKCVPRIVLSAPRLLQDVIFLDEDFEAAPEASDLSASSIEPALLARQSALHQALAREPQSLSLWRSLIGLQPSMYPAGSPAFAARLESLYTAALGSLASSPSYMDLWVDYLEFLANVDPDKSKTAYETSFEKSGDQRLMVSYVSFRMGQPDFRASSVEGLFIEVFQKLVEEESDGAVWLDWIDRLATFYGMVGRTEKAVAIGLAVTSFALGLSSWIEMAAAPGELTPDNGAEPLANLFLEWSQREAFYASRLWAPILLPAHASSTEEVDIERVVGWDEMRPFFPSHLPPGAFSEDLLLYLVGCVGRAGLLLSIVDRRAAAGDTDLACGMAQPACYFSPSPFIILASTAPPEAHAKWRYYLAFLQEVERHCAGLGWLRLWRRQVQIFLGIRCNETPNEKTTAFDWLLDELDTRQELEPGVRKAKRRQALLELETQWAHQAKETAVLASKSPLAIAYAATLIGLCEDSECSVETGSEIESGSDTAAWYQRALGFVARLGPHVVSDHRVASKRDSYWAHSSWADELGTSLSFFIECLVTSMQKASSLAYLSDRIHGGHCEPGPLVLENWLHFLARQRSKQRPGILLDEMLKLVRCVSRYPYVRWTWTTVWLSLRGREGKLERYFDLALKRPSEDHGLWNLLLLNTSSTGPYHRRLLEEGVRHFPRIQPYWARLLHAVSKDPSERPADASRALRSLVYQMLQACPAYKVLYCSAIETLAGECESAPAGREQGSELEEILNVMEEKELRIHVLLEELKAEQATV